MPNNLLHNLSGTSNICLCQVFYTCTLLLFSWVLCQGPRGNKELSRISCRAQAWCFPFWDSPCRVFGPRTSGLFIRNVIQNTKNWMTSGSAEVFLCYVLLTAKKYAPKRKVFAVYATKAYWGVEVNLHSFLTSVLDAGEFSVLRTCSFTPTENKRLVGLPKLVWTFCRTNLLLPVACVGFLAPGASSHNGWP